MTELEDDDSCLLEEGEDNEPSLGSVDGAMWWVRGKPAGRLGLALRLLPIRIQAGFGPALSQ
jgi:hypothetical protein